MRPYYCEISDRVAANLNQTLNISSLRATKEKEEKNRDGKIILGQTAK